MFPFRLIRHCLTINAHAQRFQMTNRIMCQERETLLKLNFFQIVEQYCSCGSLLILIYWLDAHDLKWRKCACDKVIKNTSFRVRIQLYRRGIYYRIYSISYQTGFYLNFQTDLCRHQRETSRPSRHPSTSWESNHIPSWRRCYVP